jgi:hypothetical protein
MSTLPIADYALLSDCRSAALVSRTGSVDWLCFPRFDGPSVFARLLDDDAGHFRVRPAGGEVEASRAYVDQTMALETTFRTPTGVAVLVDALAVGRNERGHDLGAGSPGLLLRRVTCVEGSVELEVEYAPRPEYGLIHPILTPVGGGVAARGGADVLLLSTPVELAVEGATASGRLILRAGEAVGFALHHARSWEAQPTIWSQGEIAGRRAPRTGSRAGRPPVPSGGRRPPPSDRRVHRRAAASERRSSRVMPRQASATPGRPPRSRDKPGMNRAQLVQDQPVAAGAGLAASSVAAPAPTSRGGWIRLRVTAGSTAGRGGAA